MGLLLVIMGPTLLAGMIAMSVGAAGEKWRWRMSDPVEMYAMATSGFCVVFGIILLAQGS